MGTKALVASTASAVTVSAGSVVAFPSQGEDLWSDRDVTALADLRVVGSFSASSGFTVRTRATFSDSDGCVVASAVMESTPASSTAGQASTNLSWRFDGPHVHADEWLEIENTSSTDLTVEQLGAVWTSG